MPTAPAGSYLIAFDVDGTLITSRDGRVIWQLLNQRFGSDPATDGRRFKAYLRGEITYPQWVDLDVGQWVEVAATREQMVEVILDQMRLVTGARETVETLRRWGFRLAVISGTIDLTLEVLLPRHPFDEVFTNRIWFNDDGRIAGWKATPYDMEGKADALRAIARKIGVPLRRTVYVGDNFNDVPVMAAAGLAVAFEPKEDTVRAAADLVVEDDLCQLLPLLRRQGLPCP